MDGSTLGQASTASTLAYLRHQHQEVVARGLVEREEAWRQQSWRGPAVSPRPLDASLPRRRRHTTGELPPLRLIQQQPTSPPRMSAGTSTSTRPLTAQGLQPLDRELHGAAPGICAAPSAVGASVAHVSTAERTEETRPELSFEEKGAGDGCGSAGRGGNVVHALPQNGGSRGAVKPEGDRSARTLETPQRSGQCKDSRTQLDGLGEARLLPDAGLEAKLNATPRATSVSAAPSRPRSTVQNQRAIRL